MKHLFLLATALLALAILPACTHNGGDLDGWFGTWNVQQIDSNHVTMKSYGGNLFFQFQGKILKQLIPGSHESLVSYGNWKEQGNQLIMTFPDSAYHTLPGPGLADTTQFTIVKKPSDHAQLQITDASGTLYLYYLHRVP